MVEQARHNVIREINTELLFTYWNVGRLIAEKEIQDKNDEHSSREMMIMLSKELTREVGRGFSRSNLAYMTLLFLTYKFVQTPAGKIELIAGQTI
ncbi:MAG TPA: DUF1016 N-terminal domain-containing protein [Chitinophagaceae bacterium]|nr:DUF1016 N-terminal domain-containing protein [Chitinophagaceae bacterium]